MGFCFSCAVDPDEVREKAYNRGYHARDAEIERLQSSLTLSREEGRREGMEEAAQIVTCSSWHAVALYGQTALDDLVKKIRAAAIRSEAKGETHQG